MARWGARELLPQDAQETDAIPPEPVTKAGRSPLGGNTTLACAGPSW